MKKMVKVISNILHTSASGSISALRPATMALTKITKAGITSNRRRKVAFSSLSSSSSPLARLAFAAAAFGLAFGLDGELGVFDGFKVIGCGFPGGRL